MIFSKKLDGHSFYHFLGCMIITVLLCSILKWNVIESGLMAFFLGIVWEAFDEWNHRLNLRISFFDPRGGDGLDIIVDFLGCWLACIILAFIGY